MIAASDQVQSHGGAMITIYGDEGTKVSFPEWVRDLHSFRRWTDSEEFPEEGNTWWLCGEVWVDMSKQQIFTHVLVKTVVTPVLHRLVEEEKSGLMLADGVLLTNFPADISGNPDALFLSNDGLDSGEARLIESKDGGYLEVQGSPDMVLEVVSASSVRKDTEVLREAYWEAGVKEYWLVDAREEPLSFDILRRTARSYVATRKQSGWVKSNVFGKSFRLVQGVDARRLPTLRLEVR
jgi:Uma2 family endonuclease